MSDVGTWHGGAFGHAQCVLADNASPMTLDGTNTWILRAEKAGPSLVIDPGPLDETHLAAVATAAGDVTAVLLTHGHPDHSESARHFAEMVGCGVRALDPMFVYGAEGLHDGDVVEVDGLEVRVVGTPGHTSDSLSFVLPADHAVLTGDTVLGRGTTVVAHPDGALGAYLGSLRRLRDLAEATGITTVLPGHGPVLGDALAILDHYLAHRAQRLEQVREAVETLRVRRTEAGRGVQSGVGGARSAGDADRGRFGAASAMSAAGGAGAGSAGSAASGAGLVGGVDPMDVVRLVYADVDERLWPAAELSVRAQLDYLRTAP